LITAAGLLAACALASAGAATADAPTVEEFPVGFVLTSDTCPNLPEGTTITASGSEKSITQVRTDRNGAMTVMNTTHAHGTATDQAGNSYVFNYANSFRVANSGPTDVVFSGTMTDSFSLAGPGPAKLHNGFVAAFTTDFDTLFAFVERSSRGDPIDFESGASICDPL
jgi:hypothetical protein